MHNGTAKADVTGGGVDRLWMSGSRTVAHAVVGGTQKGAAFQHFSRNRDFRRLGVEAVF